MRNHSMMINQLLLGGAVLDQTLVFGIALGDQAAVALGVVLQRLNRRKKHTHKKMGYSAITIKNF